MCIPVEGIKYISFFPNKDIVIVHGTIQCVN